MHVLCASCLRVCLFTLDCVTSPCSNCCAGGQAVKPEIHFTSWLFGHISFKVVIFLFAPPEFALTLQSVCVCLLIFVSWEDLSAVFQLLSPACSATSQDPTRYN